MCKEVSLVVQRQLVDLFKDSKLGVEIYTEEQIPSINYDYWIPMMDLPIVCETKPSTIPKAGGYLKVPKAKINAYKNSILMTMIKLRLVFAMKVHSHPKKRTEIFRCHICTL